jgi:hypothetical protein
VTTRSIGYVGAHQRVYRAHGSAAEHSCACGAQAKYWAYNHESPDPNELVSPEGQRYSGEPSYYLPMCAPCHARFDRKHITHCPSGHPYSGGNLLIENGKRKCRACVYARNRERNRKGLTPEARARKSQLQRERRAARRAANEQP